MSSDLDVIKAIVDAFEQSDWTDIEVSSGSLRIHLSTRPHAPSSSAPAIAAEPTDATTASDPGSHATVPAGAHVVISPSPGIFWRSPHPGAPHFADVGDDVRCGSTLAIVEVMKLMNHISSSIPGSVVGVFVENGSRVDRGDALFAIQPSASP